MESDCPVTIEGEARELGHRQEWDGTRIGSGNMVMTSKSESGYTYDLEFLKPWKSKSTTEFKFEGKGGETLVTWVMNGTLPIFMFFLKKMMSAWVGSDYDRGLSMLKEYLETGTVQSETEITGEQTKAGFYYLGIRKATSLEDMPSVMAKDCGQLMEWVNTSELPQPKESICFYHKYDIVSQRCDFTSALVYDEIPENTRSLVSGHIDEHRVLQVVHTGPYLHLGNAWSAVISEQRSKKLKANKKIPWYERYLNSPEEVETDELKTEINIPIR